MLAGDGWPVELQSDQAIRADPLEPEMTRGIRGGLNGNGNGISSEESLLELVACPFLRLGSLYLRGQVIPGCRLNLEEAKYAAPQPVSLPDLGWRR